MPSWRPAATRGYAMLYAFLWGGFGGTLPTLSRMAATYTTHIAQPLPELTVLLGLLLWAIVGGGIALTAASHDMRQAIFAGIAAPGILTSILAGAEMPRDTAPDKAATTTSIWYSFSAHAQPLPNIATDDALSGKAITITPEVVGGLPRSVTLPVIAEIDRDGTRESVDVGSIRNLWGESTFVLPEGTTSVSVSGVRIETMEPITEIELSVRTSPSRFGDLLWALGANRTFSIDEIVATPTHRAPE